MQDYDARILGFVGQVSEASWISAASFLIESV